MCLVALITTGDAEWKALSTFLNRIFPNITFRAEKAESFSSARLTHPAPRRENVPTTAEKLAARLVAAVSPGRRTRREQPADFAYVVDDLEVFNLDQPRIVTNVFLDAVKHHVETHTWQQSRDEIYSALREKAAFHLLSPMLEAYFFADNNAIVAAGAKRTPELEPGRDLEQFRVSDAQYARAVEQLQPIRQDNHTWTALEWYLQHPKHYLRYLIQPTSPYNPKTRSYKETSHGVNAINALNPAKVYANSAQVAFLRSLLYDLADTVGMTPPYPFEGNTCDTTYRLDHPQNTLRNM